MSPSATDVVDVYQLHLLLREIIPAIWRRVLVRSDSSLADLHHTIQWTMGWSDDHLNRFTIHGKAYGVPHDGGIDFADRAEEVRLCDVGIRLQERFLYECDFTDGCALTCDWSSACGWTRMARIRSALVEVAHVRRRAVAGRGSLWRSKTNTVDGARRAPAPTGSNPDLERGPPKYLRSLVSRHAGGRLAPGMFHSP